jgi:hypothetical protein
MAERIDGDAGQSIQVGLAILIKKAASFAMSKGDWQPGIGVHHVVRHHGSPRKPAARKTDGGQNAVAAVLACRAILSQKSRHV